MKWRRRRYNVTSTAPTPPRATGEETRPPCACAECRELTAATTNIPRPRSPVPIMPASPPPIPTTRTGDGEGDGFTDLVMVLAIAGAFGIILALSLIHI